MSKDVTKTWTWRLLEWRMWFSTTWISEVIWWIRHRTTNKFHVNKLTSLPPGYYDPDTLILHHAFDIFADFMKYQLSKDSHVVWEYSEKDFPEFLLEENPESVKKEIEDRNATWAEMKDLYHWWTEVYPNQEDTLPEFPKLPEEWGRMAMFKEQYRDTPEAQEWRRIADIHHAMEEQWNKDEDDNLIRLMKIRRSLWD